MNIKKYQLLNRLLLVASAVVLVVWLSGGRRENLEGGAANAIKYVKERPLDKPLNPYVVYNLAAASSSDEEKLARIISIAEKQSRSKLIEHLETI
jgi:hypothetical protein